MERIQKVLANCEQGLSTDEKAHARANKVGGYDK